MIWMKGVSVGGQWREKDSITRSKDMFEALTGERVSADDNSFRFRVICKQFLRSGGNDVHLLKGLSIIIIFD